MLLLLCVCVCVCVCVFFLNANFGVTVMFVCLLYNILCFCSIGINILRFFLIRNNTTKERKVDDISDFVLMKLKVC